MPWVFFLTKTVVTLPFFSFLIFLSIQTYQLQLASFSALITSLLCSFRLCHESLHNTQSSCGSSVSLCFKPINDISTLEQHANAKK